MNMIINGSFLYKNINEQQNTYFRYILLTHMLICFRIICVWKKYFGVSWRFLKINFFFHFIYFFHQDQNNYILHKSFKSKKYLTRGFKGYWFQINIEYKGSMVLLIDIFHIIFYNIKSLMYWIFVGLWVTRK